MAEGNQETIVDAETVDKLHRHLFGQQTFSSWQGQVENLLVGIELEYFLARADNDRILMRRREFEEFLKHMEGHGFNRQFSRGQTARISRDASPGFIVIEPDFAYHLLEVALPPRLDPTELLNMLESTLSTIDEVLAAMGFQRLRTGILTDPPGDDFDRVNLQRLDGVVETFINHGLAAGANHPLFAPNLAAYLAATHIHLNAVDNSDSLAALPALFEIEWLAHSLFSRCKNFRGVDYGNARALMYTHTFPDSYELVHIPKDIPNSIEQLAMCYARSQPKLFPQEPILGIKDMSVIRAKPFGTFEFRSACSMPTAQEILQVAAFRVLQLLYGASFKNNLINGPAAWQRNAALSLASLTQPDENVLAAMKESLARLHQITVTMPTNWLGYLPKFSSDLQSIIRNMRENQRA